ncbi:hypothetical protein P7K49_016274, partial [Saguinus oedipus]
MHTELRRSSTVDCQLPELARKCSLNCGLPRRDVQSHADTATAPRPGQMSSCFISCLGSIRDT